MSGVAQSSKVVHDMDTEACVAAIAAVMMGAGMLGYARGYRAATKAADFRSAE